ncbi:MAG TPA: hypothetical protein VEC12_01880 [Bacteroidia bacterium]|nr:hypothetical protein [Bacteroidia bacterium]
MHTLKKLSVNRLMMIVALIFSTLIYSCSAGDEILPPGSQPPYENPQPGTRPGPSDPNDPEAGFVNYVIPQGAQNCLQSGIRPVSGDSLVFQVKFDNSAVYTSVNPGNQEDINKLFGFSDCGTQHHQNSARFGWRYYNGNIELLAYTYSEGARAHKLLSSVSANVVYTCTLVSKPSGYVFYINGQELAVMPRGCNSGQKFRLYPYFGGDEHAPHEVSIKIKEIRN